MELDKKLIGHEFKPFTATVEAGKIKLFCKAIGEEDPIYSDEDNLHMAMAIAAVGNGWGGTTAGDLSALAGLQDWVLYPRLLASPDPKVAATARAFNEEMGGLASAFSGYCDKWSAAAIGADWAGYCADSRDIIDALTNRILRENRELLPLIDRLDRAA